MESKSADPALDIVILCTPQVDRQELGVVFAQDSEQVVHAVIVRGAGDGGADGELHGQGGLQHGGKLNIAGHLEVVLLLPPGLGLQAVVAVHCAQNSSGRFICSSRPRRGEREVGGCQWMLRS